jgi:ABC-type lipoprotein release transport system permease subunit
VGILYTDADLDVDREALGAMASFAALMGMFCALACVVPTRRALRIQPTEALKDER